jgi:hypothetical protein
MHIHHVTYAMPNAKKDAQRKVMNMLQRSSHTNLTNHRLLEGRKEELDTTGTREKKHKTHKLPLNTCNRAKEHTKLTLGTHDRAKSTLSAHAPPQLMH